MVSLAEVARGITLVPGCSCVTCREAHYVGTVAEARAGELLVSCLTPQQRQDFVQQGWFTHEGAHGRYRFTLYGVGGWVDAREDYHHLCISTTGGLPLADNCVALLLLLRADEKEFRRVMNTPHFAYSPFRY